MLVQQGSKIFTSIRDVGVLHILLQPLVITKLSLRFLLQMVPAAGGCEHMHCAGLAPEWGFSLMGTHCAAGLARPCIGDRTGHLGQARLF